MTAKPATSLQHCELEEAGKNWTIAHDAPQPASVTAKLPLSRAESSLLPAALQQAPLFFKADPEPCELATAAPLQSSQAALSRISLPSIARIAMSDQQPKLSMTSKEWVIPPRPKPGRKPATDTPPTKRKAQNRAAQRAFRERRAARVGELEDLLDEQKKSYDVKEQELNQKIRDLEMDVQSFRSRCLLLESMLERERQERIRAEMQAQVPSRHNVHDSFRADDKDFSPHRAFSQGQRQSGHGLSDERFVQAQPSRHFSISQIITPPETMDHQSSHDMSDAPLTCGDCTPTGACACAEEVLASVVHECGKCGFGASCACLNGASQMPAEPESLKRPASPSGQISGEKRFRPDETGAEAETDFTSIFPKKTSPATSQPQPSILSQFSSGDSISLRDSCGFCKDGTYCVCAEAAMATPAMTPTEILPAPLSVARQTRTPPPSEHDVQGPMAMEMTADGAVKLPPRKPKARPTQTETSSSSPRGCGPNGPGTCAQCQADPKSGLFCRLMAANFDREKGKSGAGSCCGGGGGKGGGCCKAEPAQSKKDVIRLPSLPSLGLSCAEAYQTLSSHRNFERAADDIGSWLPKLKATPNDGSQPSRPGRMPIEVEAASIMSVLKEFDVRFARDC